MTAAMTQVPVPTAMTSKISLPNFGTYQGAWPRDSATVPAPFVQAPLPSPLGSGAFFSRIIWRIPEIIVSLQPKRYKHYSHDNR